MHKPLETGVFLSHNKEVEQQIFFIRRNNYMKTRVAVLYGGKSVEHEVSVISGIQALMNINTEKY